jgi:hypothetical protein
MTKCGVTVVALAALALSAAPALAKDGWIVRICRGFTEASKIKISVAAPNGKDHLLVNWQSDNKKTDFRVKGQLAKAKQLHVTADSEPADGKVSMCVLYGGKAVKAMNFNDLLDVTGDQTAGVDSGCKCPKSGGQ